jgi:ABC-type transport system involved in multi-copper enzyme maturation permease subunit
LLLIAFILTPVFWFSHADPVELFIGPPQILWRNEASAFSQRFALVLLEAVLFAVAAMTPGYAATAIADEKERQTLPLLLTTALSDREIVLGKATARLVFVLAAAAAAFPVLTIVLFLGGIDGALLLVGSGLIVGTAVLCVAIGVHAGSALPDLRSALLRAYGVAAVLVCGAFIPPFVLITPFGILGWLESAGVEPVPAILAGIGYPAIQILIALGFFGDALRRLRLEDPIHRPPRVLTIPTVPDPYVSDREPDDPRDFPSSTNAMNRPRVADENPLLWKERYVSGRANKAQGLLVAFAFGGLGLLLIAIGLLVIISRLWNERPAPDEGGRLVMTGGTLLLGLHLFPAAIRLSSAIARERRRQTLEPLLALPLDRRTILRTKVRAAVESGWWWLPLGVVAAGVSFGADGGWQLGVAAAAFVLAGTCFAVGLGAYLTVRCPSEVRAFRFLVPAVVVVVGALVGVWNVTDWDRPELSVAGLGATAVAFALLAVLLWQRAGRALDRVL